MNLAIKVQQSILHFVAEEFLFNLYLNFTIPMNFVYLKLKSFFIFLKFVDLIIRIHHLLTPIYILHFF
ncbi:hypothetical protein BpHYR1_020159 [Brachionus plicatilis]|uniref:Uncharacterized protein n=1 Tax=Brachionus plicatilis TaxID=10195 RepID=A0A3M7PXB7_BRAPC|nr:hypothetical protein BpHYR1_020159 [Brachionus plicatilis]